jgi:hypothetical protein
MPSTDIDARLEQIATKLRAAARGKFQPFGAESHGLRRRRRLTERQVAAFERRHAVTLPEEYRAFVTGVANGGAGPAYGLFSLAEAVTAEPRGRVPDDFLRTPFRHRRAYNPLDDPKFASFWRRVEDGEIEEDEADRRHLYQAAGTLVLCHEGCGILHLLVVTGPTRGKMWVDDRCDDMGLYPLEVGFFDWYERWLDSTLAGGNGIWWHEGLQE